VNDATPEDDEPNSFVENSKNLSPISHLRSASADRLSLSEVIPARYRLELPVDAH
jgi:hypothetical protein